MRVGGVGEWEHPVDDHVEVAFGYAADDVGDVGTQARRVDHWAEAEAAQGAVAEEERGRIDHRRLPGRRPEEDHRATLARSKDQLLRHGPANGIEGQVDTDAVGECKDASAHVLGEIVDAVVEAESARCVTLFVARTRPDHPRPGLRRELHRRETDSSRRALHQHRAAGGETALLEQRLVGGSERDRQARRRCRVGAVGQDPAMVGPHRPEFRM
ncbi:hypothetical protein PV706_32495 [Streptomyces europaeiscabiei]|uniref:Uncharacterized protein n=1 Tax=Streptomyces europaeiscabiei TaxID=146819 RepID=A0ABU4NZ68_9ACTN|nr:hypothetical protein [Streptomyces europaeiscabiei]MDX3549704.1 hypothetical protein [Streptomyces europaeiscabiei]MDX3558991.1 hypothetical protein [Streptomyces europaeiscabiei]MDX3706969.1 hypothetical protein [Streptomyces europaeiscabiei]MDX3867143.1 hypothetical protein [Streptomyces europaeiscabiei]MDX3874306.1 hypothetical protein [Streptomyces europaeiscabiei]